MFSHGTHRDVSYVLSEKDHTSGDDYYWGKLLSNGYN